MVVRKSTIQYPMLMRGLTATRGGICVHTGVAGIVHPVGLIESGQQVWRLGEAEILRRRRGQGSMAMTRRAAGLIMLWLSGGSRRCRVVGIRLLRGGNRLRDLVAEDRVVSHTGALRLLTIPALWSAFVALWRKKEVSARTRR